MQVRCIARAAISTAILKSQSVTVSAKFITRTNNSRHNIQSKEKENEEDKKKRKKTTTLFELYKTFDRWVWFTDGYSRGRNTPALQFSRVQGPPFTSFALPGAFGGFNVYAWKMQVILLHSFVHLSSGEPLDSFFLKGAVLQAKKKYNKPSSTDKWITHKREKEREGEWERSGGTHEASAPLHLYSSL